MKMQRKGRVLCASICLMLQHLQVRPAHALPHASASVGAAHRASRAPRVDGASIGRGEDNGSVTCVGAGRAGRADDSVAGSAGTSPEPKVKGAASRRDAQGLALRGGGAVAEAIDLKVPTFRQVTVPGPEQTKMLSSSLAY